MCFSLAWIAHLLIQLIVLAAVVAILRIIIPWILTQLGVNASPIIQVVTIIIWAVAFIWIIWFVIDLLSCLTHGGTVHRFPEW